MTVKAPLTAWLEHVQEFDGHWLWNGRVHSGIPVLLLTVNGNQIRKSARRVMWIYLNGPIPRSRRVLNTCGVKVCVHPAHSRLEELP